MRTALFFVIRQGAVVNSLISYGGITTTRCVVTYKKAVLGLFVVSPVLLGEIVYNALN
jgi:hypothetical protein